MNELPIKSVKSGSFGADKLFVGQTDVQLDLRWLWVEEMEEYPIFIYKALPLRCLLVHIYTAGCCYSMGATLAATCIRRPWVTLSCTASYVYHFSRKRDHQDTYKYRINKSEKQKHFSTRYPEPDVSKLSLGPNRLPGRPCWCQRMFATLWITLVSVPKYEWVKPSWWLGQLSSIPSTSFFSHPLLSERAVSHMLRCYSNQWLTCGYKAKQVHM